MTAHITAKPEPRSPEDQSERCLRAVERLTQEVGVLARQCLDEGHVLQAGMLGASVGVLRQVTATLDSVAAKLNDRLRKDELHGVREDAEQQTGTVQQMQLL
jgi:hypothetical protein